MAQKLTYAKVFNACVKAWNDSSLLLKAKLDGEVRGAGCVYSYIGRNDREYRCAVGAALNDNVIAQLIDNACLNSCAVAQLAADEYIEAEPLELSQIAHLQRMHDAALNGGSDCVENFKKLIGV